MTITERIIEINRQCQEIADQFPWDYHRRGDFQSLVDVRSRIIAESKKTEKSSCAWIGN